MIVRVQTHPQSDLVQIRGAARGPAGLQRPAEAGHEQGGQNGDDGDDHEQFDQGEARLGDSSPRGAVFSPSPDEFRTTIRVGMGGYR